MVVADSGAKGAASSPSVGTGVTYVTREKKRAQEEATRGLERMQLASTVGMWRRLEGRAGKAQSRDVEVEPQHLANDIEGKAAWVSREARRLCELEADIKHI